MIEVKPHSGRIFCSDSSSIFRSDTYSIWGGCAPCSAATSRGVGEGCKCTYPCFSVNGLGSGPPLCSILGGYVIFLILVF